MHIHTTCTLPTSPSLPSLLSSAFSALSEKRPQLLLTNQILAQAKLSPVWQPELYPPPQLIVTIQLSPRFPHLAP
jgi:hypothetical protein